MRKLFTPHLPPPHPVSRSAFLKCNTTPCRSVVCVSTATTTTPTTTAKIIQAAKEDSDAFLTGLMNQELAQKADGKGGEQDKTQGPKAESKGTAAAVEVGGVQRDTGGAEPMEVELCGSSGGAASPRQKGSPVVSGVYMGALVCGSPL